MKRSSCICAYMCIIAPIYQHQKNRIPIKTPCALVAGETHGCNSTQLSGERLHFQNYFQIYEKMKQKIQVFDFQKPFFRNTLLVTLLLMFLIHEAKAQGQPWVICSTDVTWSPQNLPPSLAMNGIRVRCKATLTISDIDMDFFQGARIEVEAGSKLIVRNSKLDVYLGTLPWSGIFVNGVSSLSQGRDPATGCFNQGIVELDNVTIENAVFGVITGAFNGSTLGYCLLGLPSPSTGGGVIRANNTTFKNNLVDVKFVGYVAPGGVDNVSFFNNCHSYITDDYQMIDQCPNDLETVLPFFELKGVKGIKIRGHIFEDQRSITNTANPSNKIGIETSGASIKLDKFGFGNTNRSKFKNLDYGIDFGGNGPGISTVRNADFECWHGILSQAMSNGITIFNNNFTVRRTTNHTIPSYGLYLDRSNAYNVSYNTFFGENVNAPSDGGVGIIVRNQHPNFTQVYNNDFDDLIIATEAVGQNTDEISGTLGTGLEYRCNNFSDHLIDIAVLDDLNFTPSSAITGIKEYQYLTANRFGEDANSFIDISLFNEPVALPFRYIHHNDATDPRLSPSSNVGNITVIESPQPSLPNDCPEIFLVSDPDIGVLGDIKNTKGDLFNETLGTLGDLVDNGNTPQMVNWVQTANHPRRAIRVYFKIMQQAPFTSNATLEEVSKKEVGFSKGMIRNILRQHPQAAKSAQIQENLDNRVNQLPQFMRNQINQGLNTIGAKEQMELEANTYKKERNQAINQAVLLLGADTLDRSDEMIGFLSGTGELGFQYRIADIYDQSGETEQSDAILADIGTWELSEKEAADHEAHLGLRSLTQGWQLEGKDLGALTEEDLASLHDYAVQPNITAGKAVAILRLNGNTDYPEPVYFPELPTEERRIVEAQDDLISNISVYPNPASSYFSVRYDLSGHENLLLQIVDITGKIVHQRQLNQVQDELTLITESYPTGQYVLSIYADNQLIESKKINIAK